MLSGFFICDFAGGVAVIYTVLVLFSFVKINIDREREREVEVFAFHFIAFCIASVFIPFQILSISFEKKYELKNQN